MTPRSLCLALVFLASLGASSVDAKEESKIQIRLERLGGGGGQLRGDVRTQLQEDVTRLRLHVRGAEPETEHVLLAKEAPEDEEGAELGRFTTGSNGQWTGTFALGKGDESEAPADPRGRFLVVADDADEILGAWLYGAVEDDAPKTKVKEQTGLEPDAETAPSGSAAARYDLRPNGMGTFRVTLRGVPAGDYDVWVDGVMVDELTPNSAGNAEASFTTRLRGSPRSRPHHTKRQLTFDPRRKLVELKQGDDVYFSGPMLAQIEGVNTCATSDSTVMFALGPGQVEGSGEVRRTIEADCETSLSIEVADLPAATYDVRVDAALVGSLMVMDDGMGNLSGVVVFDPTPDAPGELALDFPVGSGSVVQIFAEGESAPAETPLLEATLP
jgi:hypothetical protein